MNNDLLNVRKNITLFNDGKESVREQSSILCIIDHGS